MNYGAVLAKSFETFWKHKSLWVFGILLGLFGQAEYSFSVNFRQSGYTTRSDPTQALQDFPGRELLLNFLDNPLPYLLALLAINVVFALIGLFVRWLGHGAMISMVDEVDRTGATSVGSGLRAGAPRAVSLSLLSLLVNLPTIIVSVIASAWGLWVLLQFAGLFKALLTGVEPSNYELDELVSNMIPNIMISLVCMLPLLCLGSIAGWLLGVYNQLCARAMLLENLSLTASLQRGWQAVKTEFGFILLTGLILWGAAFAFGIAGSIPALVLSIPLAQAMLNGSWGPAAIAAAVVMAVYLLTMLIVVAGILTSFNSVLWTTLYKAILAAGQRPSIDDGQPA
jgi:hypothetical protein